MVISRPIRLALVIALSAWCQTRGLAQISPGELSEVHASLEGIGSCTSCHELGKAVVNDKCLECHKELRTRIKAGTGFHGPLAGRRCVECHKEHLGRSFNLIRFDRNAYDHARVGFPLTGRHARIACEKCHTAEYRKAADVRQNSTLRSSHTFLGLLRECTACHNDVHKGQLKSPCEQCHGFDAWKPPSAFNHDRARFRLTGKHASVACVKCHPVPQGGGPPSYAHMDFSRCSACHVDPHGGRFQKTCESCHTTQGWSVGVARGFDHSTTRFPLRGAHRTVRCEQCHGTPTRGTQGASGSRQFTVRKFDRCADCHADVHRGEFSQRPGGGACETCHTESGFTPVKFDHGTAAFSLAGKHVQVACERCHTKLSGPRTAAGAVDLHIPRFDRCAECHIDAHGGQFTTRADGGECRSCHTVEGFVPPVFTVQSHARTRFPLNGAHGALACGACHVSGAVQARSTRRFRWASLPECAACHKDVHRGQFAGRYTCASCHGTQSWGDFTFSHERTRFPLSGKHAAVPCTGCHKVAADGGRRFAGTPARCTDCHDASTIKN